MRCGPKCVFCKGHDLERSRTYVKINGTIEFLDLKNIDLDIKMLILSAFALVTIRVQAMLQNQ